MAATTPASGGECSIPVVEPTAHARFEMRRRERKLKSLNQIMFCVALSEWAGNAIGTLAMLWATVILLGAFYYCRKYL